MPKKLPIGKQSFEEMWEVEILLYVDKRHYVAKLVNEGKYSYLNRPGKRYTL